MNTVMIIEPSPFWHFVAPWPGQAPRRHARELELPDNGSCSLVNSNSENTRVFMSYERGLWKSPLSMNWKDKNWIHLNQQYDYNLDTAIYRNPLHNLTQLEENVHDSWEQRIEHDLSLILYVFLLILSALLVYKRDVSTLAWRLSLLK
jgi:hypothetical protein